MKPRAHVIDGIFDDAWRGSNEFREWVCVPSVEGRYTLAYFDFVEDPASPTGAYLFITNDWVIEKDGGAVPPGCFNLFKTQTGGGSEKWEIRVFGDATVEVRLNGGVVQGRGDPAGGGAVGAAGYGPTPNAAFNHTFFELRYPASRGSVTWRLGDPVRTFTRTNTFAAEAAAMHASSDGGGGCEGMVLVEEPNDFVLVLDPGMWDPPPPGPGPTPTPPVTTTCVTEPCGFYDLCLAATGQNCPTPAPSRSPSVSARRARVADVCFSIF